MRLSRRITFLLISMVFLCNTTLYAYSKEQIAKQNILTLFRWFEEGNLDKTEVKRIMAAVKVQLKVLKKEAASYGYLDNNLRNAFIKGYKFDSDMRLLLNCLFTETVARLELNKNAPGEKPRHPWLDIRNDLVDRLANEVAISFVATAAKGDLTKPEIFIAPDVASTADLVERGLNATLKAKLNLSGAYRLVHAGSTSRGTSLNNTDFDFELSFENQEDFNLFSGKINLIVKTLFKELRSEGYKIFSVDFSRKIMSMRLVSLMLQDKDGVIFRVHLTAGKNIRIYSDILAKQIEQIKALGGSWEYVSGQIVLFKRLVRDVLHSYGKFYGVNGIICEQFIVQAASSSDYGKKITGIGSFDKTMRWIYSIGFNQDSSTIIPFEIATKQVGIYKYADKYLKVECLPVFWNQLVNAARKYVVLGNTEMSEDDFASLGN